MFRLSAILLLLSFALIQSANAAGWPGTEFVSANRQYFVELSRTPENEILLTVLRATNDTKVLHWSRKIEWVEPHPFWNSGIIHEVKALVTNDGNTVVLRDFNTPSVKNGIRILRKSSPEDHETNPFDRRELTAALPEVAPPGLMRMGTSYLHLTSVFDFIHEEKNGYALWFGQTDQWLLISLNDFKQTIVRDTETVNALNKIAYTKAKDLALLHQPPPLRKIIGSLKDRIAEFVPSLSTPKTPSYMHGDTTAAYFFLATRRVNSDASLIERLVTFPQEGIQHGHGHMDERVDLDFSVSYSQRVIGDYLWSRWNGDTNREIIAKEMYHLLPQDTFRYLGSITFNLEFPIDLPSTNAGTLWAYIIPANVAPEKWQRSSDVLTFQSMLAFHPHRPVSTIGRDGKAHVRALTSGAYRAKFIWERNRPAGIWRTNIFLGTTNDYESLLTQPITVKAGETITNISVAITNLITQTSPQ